MNEDIQSPDMDAEDREDLLDDVSKDSVNGPSVDPGLIPVGAYVAVIAAIAVLVNLNTLRNGFVFDDLNRVIENPAFVSPSALFRSLYADPSRALLKYTYAMQLWCTGSSSVVFHMANVLVHTAVCVLVYFMALLTFRTAGDWVRETIPPRVAAFLTAAMFACHPLNSETVNYISARSSSMATMFYLLAVISFIRYVSSDDRRTRGFWYALSMTGFVCGLATKETLVTLPIMLMAYDFLFVSDMRTNKLVRKIVWPYGPYWAVCIAAISVSFLVGLPDPARPVWTNLMTQSHVVTEYLQLAIMPVGLSVDYAMSEYSALFTPSTLVAVSTIGVLIVLTFMMARTSPSVTFGGLWFFVTLVPSSTVIPLGILMNDHRTYLPMAGMAFLFPIAVAALLRTSLLRDRQREVGIAVLVLLAVLAVQTVMRNRVWKNELSLWQDAAVKLLDNPAADRAHARFGRALFDESRTEESASALQHAINLNPQNAAALSDLGRAARRAGRIPESIEMHKRAVEIEPTQPDLRVHLAAALQMAGRIDEAITEVETAIELEPDTGLAYISLGMLHSSTGAFDEAEQAFRKALYLEPVLDAAEKNLSDLRSRREYLRNERTRLEQAVAADPDDPALYVELGMLNLAEGNMEQAHNAFETSLDKQPSFGPALLGLGGLYVKQGKTEDAVPLLRRAAQFDTYAARAYGALVQVYSSKGQHREALKALASLEKAAGKKFPELRQRIESAVAPQ